MKPHRLWVWLLDEWAPAVERSLLDEVPPPLEALLRAQRRLGQAAKSALLLLPLLLLLSFLVPGTQLLRALIRAWALWEAAALALHVAIGFRRKVSYGWAFHHSSPLLFTGAAALHDLRAKTFLAASFGLVLLVALFAG